MSAGEKEGLSPPPLPKLGSGFEILGCLGEGGMGTVYKVRDRPSQKIYAVKVLKSDMAKDPVAVMRFEQEVRAASELTHPNLIFIHGSHRTEDGAPYMVMNYVEGESLAQSLQFLKFMPPERALPVFQQIAEALDHVHGKGIVHRDLKPSNILIYQDAARKDAVRLVDFGIAKMQNVKTTNNLTQTGELFGSPLYMSPEQCSSDVIDARSDIYSLGCVMYQTLCGTPPFDSTNAIKTMICHMQVPAKPLRSVRNDFRISKDLEAVVMRCLSKSPADRYQSARALLSDLEAVALGQKVAKSAVFNKGLSTNSKLVALVASSFTLGSICTLATLFFLGFFHSSSSDKPAVAEAKILEKKRPDVALLEPPVMGSSPEVTNHLNLFAAAQSGAQSIDYSGKKLTDDSLQSLPADRRLESLDLSATGISDKGLRELIKCPVLTDLKISNNALITDSGMESISRINQLRDLDISETSVGDKGMTLVGTLPELRKLSLLKTSVSDKGLSSLSHLRKLVSINMGTTRVTDKSMKVLSSWPNLGELSLSSDEITDAGAACLRYTPNLIYLNLHGTKITKSSLSTIAALKGMRNLILPDSFDDECTRILSKLPNLEAYAMSDSMTEQSLQYLTGRPRLHKIIAGSRMRPGSPALLKVLADNPRCKIEFRSVMLN